MRKEKRSHKDWSDHELNIITTNIGDTEDHIFIHELKKPDTRIQSVKFINTQGIMTVTGDYGHWIFCREFHPSPEGYVSDHYWLEKMQIATGQEPLQFDREGTRQAIHEKLSSLEEEGYEGEELKEVQKYFKKCLRHTDNELMYLYHAHMELPSWADFEFAIHCKKPEPWIPIIFDAFDEICRRLKKRQNNAES